MIAFPRNARFLLAAAASVLTFISLFVYYDFPLTSLTTRLTTNGRTSWTSPADADFDTPADFAFDASVTPANSTLGFGGIFVVSGPGSPRRDHLEQAAAVTELDLTIPEQIAWSDDDIKRFRGAKADKSNVGNGSIKAWLSHHLVLKAFLETDLETALIIENDVDWDIRLRTQQIPLTQRATREIFPPQLEPVEQYPWGTTGDWDVLFLGTCGDYFNPVDEPIGVGHHHPEHLRNIPHNVFADDSMPYPTDLHPWTASLLTAFRIPDKHRIVHQSIFPLCTFGYAVTRSAAEKILTKVAPASEELMPYSHAFDVALLNGCGWQHTQIIRCITVQPELFHHMPGASIIGQIEGNSHMAPADEEGLEQSWYRKETSNILCGFFSGEFYWNGNPMKLEYLQEEVGRKGRCLKPGREERDGRAFFPAPNSPARV